jgi:hypothetical protein
MIDQETNETADTGGRQMRRTYVGVIIVEVIVLLLLWSVSQYFG